MLTTRQAARRVGRTTRTIYNWRAWGMPVLLQERRLYVDEDVLLATYRAHLMANPAHRWRMRKLARHAEGLDNLTR
mgnify:CR=1 FL=1